jgi:hypothetical protein
MKTALSNLAAHWNRNYWLFVASGKVHLMRYDAEGERVVNPDGGMSQTAIIWSVDFPADGGDW